MKKLFLLCALASAVPAAAYDRGELQELNDAYKSGRYEEALEGYKAMAAAEPDNPWAYYNAGNALFRLNRMGPAIFYYSKAFVLDPRSSDIRANLEFALRQTGQTLAPEGAPKILHYLYYLLSESEIKTLGIVLFWLACLAGAAGFLLDGSRSGKFSGRASLAAAGLLVLCLGWLAARQSSPFHEAGVVTRPEGAKMLSGPGGNFKTYASAPEGRLVRILDAADDTYYEIGLPKEGIKGWALKTEVEKL